jgi:hypothetical protein
MLSIVALAGAFFLRYLNYSASTTNFEVPLEIGDQTVILK